MEVAFKKRRNILRKELLREVDMMIRREEEAIMEGIWHGLVSLYMQKCIHCKIIIDFIKNAYFSYAVQEHMRKSM